MHAIVSTKFGRQAPCDTRRCGSRTGEVRIGSLWRRRGSSGRHHHPPRDRRWPFPCDIADDGVEVAGVVEAVGRTLTPTGWTARRRGPRPGEGGTRTRRCRHHSLHELRTTRMPRAVAIIGLTHHDRDPRRRRVHRRRRRRSRGRRRIGACRAGARNVARSSSGPPVVVSKPAREAEGASFAVD